MAAWYRDTFDRPFRVSAHTVLSLATLLASPSIHAWCLETAAPQPSPLRCPPGAPLHWAGACVDVRLVPDRLPFGLTPEQAQGAIERSIAAWTSVRCDGAPPGFRVIPSAPQSVRVGYFQGGVNMNTISFEAMWPNDGVHPPGVEAITYISTDQESGQIVDADIMVNLSGAAPGVVTVTEASVQGLVTHELGHLQGLAHSAMEDAVMYPFLRSPGTRPPAADDVAGLCAAVPPRPGSVCDPTLRVVRFEGSGLTCAAAPRVHVASWTPGVLALSVFARRRRRR